MELCFGCSGVLELKSRDRSGVCRGRWRASLSEPFLQPLSRFDFPRVTVIDTKVADAFAVFGMRAQAPDLIGLLTWSVALYFGFSERRRMGTTLRDAMTEKFVALGVPETAAEAVATAVHTFPFIFAAIFIDGTTRASIGDSFAASSTPLSLFLVHNPVARTRAKSRLSVPFAHRWLFPHAVVTRI